MYVQTGCRRRSVGEPGLSRRRPPGRQRVPGNVRVAKNQDVGIREEGFAALLPALGLAGLVDHAEPDAVQRHTDRLGQAPPELVAVVIAINTDQPPAALFELVEQARADPVTRVENHVSVLDGGPHLVRQCPGALRDVGVGNKDQAQAHRSIFP